MKAFVSLSRKERTLVCYKMALSLVLILLQLAQGP